VRAKSPGDGQGATFAVALPVALAHHRSDARAPVDPPHEPALADATLDGVRVLVVDDEHDARELVRRILARSRAIIETAGSAPEALDAIARRPPDVLLSDIGMPEHDGYDLIRRVRERGLSGKQLPAIALTAFARPDDRRRALVAGFQTHVAKPVDPEELVAVVATLLGRTGGGSQ
jgi:CheY-like chemotaxis protein